MHSGLGGLGENTDRCSEPIVLFSGLWPLGLALGLEVALYFPRGMGSAGMSFLPTHF